MVGSIRAYTNALDIIGMRWNEIKGFKEKLNTSVERQADHPTTCVDVCSAFKNEVFIGVFGVKMARRSANRLSAYTRFLGIYKPAVVVEMGLIRKVKSVLNCVSWRIIPYI